MVRLVQQIPQPLERSQIRTVNAVQQIAQETDEPIAGLELTLQPPVEAEAEPLPDLEQTQLFEKDVQVPIETVPGVEHTRLEQDLDAPLNWTPGNTPLDPGREVDDGVRTPAPEESANCPWCGSPSLDAVRPPIGQ